MECRIDVLLGKLRDEVGQLIDENASLRRAAEDPAGFEDSRSARRSQASTSDWRSEETPQGEDKGKVSIVSKVKRHRMSKVAVKVSFSPEGELSGNRVSSGMAPMPTIANRSFSFGGQGLRRSNHRDSHTGDTVARASSLAAPRLSMQKSLRKRLRFGCRLQNLLIHPEESRFLKFWDLVTVFGLLWVSTVLPAQLSLMGTAPRIDSAIFVLSLTFDAIFFVDLVLQFFIMYQRWTSFGHVYEHNHRKIVKRYLTTWFTVDLVSIIPYDLLMSGSRGSEGGAVMPVQALKIIRLLRMLKLARVMRAARLFHRYETCMTINYSTIALMKSFTLLLLVTHWLACLWCGMLKMVEEEEGLPRWVDVFDTRDQHVTVKTKDSPLKIYVNAVYFVSYTITTVGYGDIGPQNIVETWVCVFILIIAGISWAIILGEVCGIFLNMHPHEHDFRDTMDNLNHMMHDRDLGPELSRKLRSFFLSKKTTLRRQKQIALVEDMSPGLQGEVIMQTNQVWIGKVPYFSKVMCEASHNSQFYAYLLDIAKSLEWAVFAAHEVFGIRHQLYILTRGLGLCKKLSPLHRKVRECLLTVGSAWGVDFMIQDKSLQNPPDARALTYVEVLSMKRGALLQSAALAGECCPGVLKQLRWYTAWLAVQHTLLRLARRRYVGRTSADFEAAREDLHSVPADGDAFYPGIDTGFPEAAAELLRGTTPGTETQSGSGDPAPFVTWDGC